MIWALLLHFVRIFVILEQGRIVEMGKTADILANPRHPYTQKLLSSIPSLWQNS